MSCKICEKILHTLFKAESSSDSLVFANSTYQRLSAFFFPAALSTAELIWTRMSLYEIDDCKRIPIPEPLSIIMLVQISCAVLSALGKEG